MELLAPAGDFAALQAALDAGADAVYFGLTSLNARRRARNFSQQEFFRAVNAVHARGAKAYLTLNIDLSERELGQAARILQLARQCSVDGLLVRDPALLALHRAFPELEFHFSTQTCMANSADVAAAGQLGARRVVLAREMTLAEIAAASSVGNVQTEVFAQGALCFSISGRCLLSSWGGGRSGNRGVCTSPCRVPWNRDGVPAGTPWSMRDLATIDRLDELRKAGVHALKIEGRLKNAAWVHQAVQLYRQALQGQDPKSLAEQVAALGAYTGRAMTSAYLDGQRGDLTGSFGRAAGSAEDPRTDPLPSEPLPPPADSLPSSDHRIEKTYDLEMRVEDRAVACRLRCAERMAEWSIPKTVVRRAHKAVSIGQFLEHLEGRVIQGCRLGQATTNDPAFLLVPRAVNALVDRISVETRLAHKAADPRVRIDLPADVARILVKPSAHPANRLHLGDRPDRVRLDAEQVRPFLQRVRPRAVLVEGLTARTLDQTLAVIRNQQLIVALPSVFFEESVPAIRALIRACARAGVVVEVNSWGGWWLARQARATMEGGPGLAVLNSLAAHQLAQLGLRCVTLSVEADRCQLEELSAHCPAPCSLVVFGRPPLAITRAELPQPHPLATVFEDRRGIRVRARREQGLWVLRPIEPFDLRASTNDRIAAHHLVVDLVGSDDPIRDWFQLPLDNRSTFRFNYDRTLA